MLLPKEQPPLTPARMRPIPVVPATFALGRRLRREASAVVGRMFDLSRSWVVVVLQHAQAKLQGAGPVVEVNDEPVARC